MKQSLIVRMSLAVAVACGLMVGVTSTFAAGTPAGTSIKNKATINYRDAGGQTFTRDSNEVETVVSQVAALTVDPNNTGSGDAGTTISYAHIVTNGGNGSDTIDLTAVSSNGWTVSLFRDTDNSGTFTPGDTALTDTDGDNTVDTGSMLADGTFRIIVRIAIPAGTANNTSDVTTVTGRSSFNTAITDNATDTTTVNAPNVTVTKSVSPGGNQPPGTVLTYSMVVTNGGAGAASNVVLTDLIPANTTYSLNTITLGGVGKTDQGSDDEADYGVTTANTVTVNIGTLAGSASVTVTFQVTIN